MLPLSRQELDFLLIALNDCQIFYSNNQRWLLATKLNKLRTKLQIDLNRYEEI